VNPESPTDAHPVLELIVEFDREDDGRWMAMIPALSGVMVYGNTREDARRRVHALALHVLADRLEAGELGELPALTLSDAA
jgi:predicted RNase H-like HicB family nuclease